jgi:hypothetical protein
MSYSPKPKRRLYRFSLKALVLLVVVIAVPLGWTMRRVREQRIALAALKETGCVVLYNFDNSETSFFQKLLPKNRSKNNFGVCGSSPTSGRGGVIELR